LLLADTLASGPKGLLLCFKAKCEIINTWSALDG